MKLMARLLDWRREVLFLFAAGMEASWIYPWFAFAVTFVAGPGYALSPIAVFVLLWLGASVMRLLESLEQDLRREQLVMVVTGIAASLLVVRWGLYGNIHFLSLRWIGALFADMGSAGLGMPPQLILFLLGLVVWARGIRLGQDALTADGVGARFRVGIVGYMIYLIVAALTQSEVYVPLLLGLFFFGLLSIALARINEQAWNRGGVRTPFTPSWMGIVLATALAVVLLGLLVSGIFSLHNMEALFAALQPIMRPLRNVLSLIVLVLVSVVVFLGELLSKALQALLGNTQYELPTDTLEQAQEQIQSQIDAVQLGAWLKISRDATLVLMTLVVVLVVFLVVRQQRRRLMAGRNVTRESILEPGDLLNDLHSLLRGGWRRLRDGAARGLAFLRGTHYATESIRRIYASLVQLAEDAGIARKQAQTPYEFADVLSAAWPDQVDDIHALTEAYVRAHYGEQPDTISDLHRALAAWERVRVTHPSLATPTPH
jgi:hypothetical protein